MDDRDSSLSAPSEEDRMAPATGGMAKEAAVLFQTRRFAECVEVLNLLLAKKEGDPKILHNITVAEYYRDGCSDPKKLLDVLEKVKKRSEELACASREQVDNNLGTNASFVLKGSGTALHQLYAADGGSVPYADEFDTSIITLNTAIVLYHLHDYEHALSILEPLYQNIDPIDETTALHVCLLLLDIALASDNPSKAADVIQYLEKSFGVGYLIQIDNGSTNQHQSSNQGTKASANSNTTALDASSSDSNASANITDNSLPDDTPEYQHLYSTLDGSGPNLGRPSPIDLAKASADRAAPATELKLKMRLYKVRLLLLTRNLKAAKREVKLAMNMARGRDSSTELLLKSQLEYARGNHRKAIKLLMTSSNGTEPRMLSIFNNNLGCIHYQLKSRHTSGLLFSKALKSSLSLRSEKPLKLSTFSQDKSLLIMYNCGLQNLSCGNPLAAAQCFGKASRIFNNRPLLWLRLAECCLLALEKGLPGSSGEDIRVHVVGSGRWRHLVIDDFNSKNGYSKEQNGGKFKISLPFAQYCLSSALLLLHKEEQNAKKFVASSTMPEEEGFSQGKLAKGSSHKDTSGGDSKVPNVSSFSVPVNSNGDSKESKGGISSNFILQNSVTTYEDARREENAMIRQALLGALAYVELGLENPSKALSYAKTLIDLPGCSKIYVFLGHVYAAEALCCLNRLKEAADHLLIYLADVNRDELPYSNEDRDTWGTKRGGGDDVLNSSLNPQTTEESHRMILTPEEARGVTYVNLARMFAMQGNLEKASRFVSEAQLLLPNNPRALLAAIHLDILQGKTQESLSKLKQFNRVRFLSTMTLSS